MNEISIRFGMTLEAPYTPDYPKVTGMLRHDRREDMRRWFEDHKNDPWAAYPEDNESMRIVARARRAAAVHPAQWRGTRRPQRDARMLYEATIYRGDHPARTVTFDVSAPPPPMLEVAAQREYVPPVPPPRRVRLFDDEEQHYRYDVLRLVASLPSVIPTSAFREMMREAAPPLPPRFRYNQ